MFEDELRELEEQGLLRTVRDRASAQGRVITVGEREFLNFASNDYLGLANHPALRQAAEKALRDFGTGGGASRLLAGGTRLHRELEEVVASLKGTDDTIVFTSGYAANTGSLPALAGPADALFSDALNHASLIDGCRLSRADRHVYRHRDMSHLAELLAQSGARRKVVVTDTVFSMDGDLAPLPELFALCREHQALLYLDDAHGTGVLGEGRGALAHWGLAPEPWIIQMGTFSKALGSLGGFVAGESGTIQLLRNRARSFFFSTALPPPVAAASLAAFSLLREDRSLISCLWNNRHVLSRGLSGLGLDSGDSATPIVPVLLSSVEEALTLAARLEAQGIYAPAIRPPTVARPRLRLTVTAAHRKEDVERLVAAM